MAYRKQNPHSSSAISSILNQGATYNERRAGNRNLQNHMNKNARAIREMEAKNREAKENASKKGDDPWKMEKFKNVKSKVFQQGDRQNSSRSQNSSRNSSRAASAEDSARRRSYLRRGANEAEYAKAREIKKDAVPRRGEVNRLAERRDKNFIAGNRMDAVEAAPKQTTRKKEESKHEEFGKVPAYLQQRNAEWKKQEEERLANMPDPDCPPGMILMPEAERLETLHTLQENEQEVRNQLDRMPLVVQVPSMVRKQKALEAKLREIEQAKKIFERPKVYIADS
eukprot:CAMPEP_0117854270 /NCGR_PEP_ID=MMETSP0949-20121206/24220_1 /TAXON_ID=44440 /ORGANISM="Chattonella subsalsa, Strain CCMP2191" /LENGTH=282 /DNA_ID=CAMNT_0005702897 /DNA_START=102 /DNA_END=950 /DNA_ORIENTATION=+